MRRLFYVISLSIITLLGTNLAHATSIVSTSPTAGSILSVSPSAVSIKANGDLVEGANSIEVTNPSGIRVDDGSIQVQGSVLLVGIKPLVTSGTYTVSYTLMVIDQESSSGTFTFIYNAPGEVTLATPQPSMSEEPLSTNNPNRITDLFVVGLMVFAFIVLVFLSRYAKQTFKTPSKPKTKRKNPSTSKKFLK
ncbi:MAG: copper resistance protein CopC [Actinobacteria bacterium]|jgi:methionine-rich copper-binding protein CopC|nr:copper resistance protein CopC [Actinomycetota bacterium]